MFNWKLRGKIFLKILPKEQILGKNDIWQQFQYRKMKKNHITSLNQIPKLAKTLSGKLKGGEIIALIGNLGSGKTTFAQHLAKFIKIKKIVNSPSFMLMNLFHGKLKNGKKITLYHLDLYRAKSFKEIRYLGITEFWGGKDSITVIEWANKIKKYLPKKTLFIYFKN